MKITSSQPAAMPIEQYESCARDAALDCTEVSWEDLLLKIFSKKICFQFVRIRWEARRCAAQRSCPICWSFQKCCKFAHFLVIFEQSNPLKNISEATMFGVSRAFFRFAAVLFGFAAITSATFVHTEPLRVNDDVRVVGVTFESGRFAGYQIRPAIKYQAHDRILTSISTSFYFLQPRTATPSRYEPRKMPSPATFSSSTLVEVLLATRYRAIPARSGTKLSILEKKTSTSRPS